MDSIIDKVWEATTGSDFAYCSDFILGIEGGTLKFPSDLNFTYVTLDGGESEKYITPQDLVDAYTKAKTDKHCGNESIDVEDYDACFAYTVLQYAIYGEVHFG